MSEGSIVIEILGDASDFNAKVEGLGAKTQSALSSVSSSLTAWGAGLTAAVTLPLGAAGAKAMQWALTTASAAEQADIAFSTMLGPERAKQMIADLTEFAKRTPFEMSGLTDATQKLLAYGFAADDVIPTLRAIGDATAALGSGQEGIDACTRAIGQMQAKGKVMSEEMLQLTEQGIPAWKYLAEALGTDVAGAQEMVTKGSVDAATGIAALKEAGAEFIIAALHWGDEGAYDVNALQLEQGHAAIDAGADVVYGSHPHTLQPIEVYNDHYIFYSMGNWSFGGNTNPRDKDTVIAKLEVTRDGDGSVSVTNLKLIPCASSGVVDGNNYQPVPYEEGSEEYERTISKLEGSFTGANLTIPYEYGFNEY